MMKDELLDQAKEWSRKQGFVSVSYLQRIMRIGYTRASRLVDCMIEDGFCQNEYIAGTGHRQIIEAVEHGVHPTNEADEQIEEDLHNDNDRIGEGIARFIRG